MHRSYAAALGFPAAHRADRRVSVAQPVIERLESQAREEERQRARRARGRTVLAAYLISLVVLGGLSMAVVARTVDLLEAQSRLNALVREARQLEQERQALAARVSELSAPARIEAIATQRLNMVKIGPADVRVAVLAPPAVAALAPETAPLARSGFWARLLGRLLRVSGTAEASAPR